MGPRSASSVTVGVSGHLLFSQPGGQHGSEQLARHNSESGEHRPDILYAFVEAFGGMLTSFPLRWRILNANQYLQSCELSISFSVRALPSLSQRIKIFRDLVLGGGGGNHVSNLVRHACICLHSLSWGACHHSNRSRRSNSFSVGDLLAIFSHAPVGAK